MKKAQKEYINTIAQNLGTALVIVSKGRAWIEIDEKKETLRMTGLTKRDAKQAGIIQMMFNNAVEQKHFPVEEVQNALDYFGWDLHLQRTEKGVNFMGEDKFLLVQISYYMGAIDIKKYAKMVRNAVKEDQRIYFV